MIAWQLHLIGAGLSGEKNPADLKAFLPGVEWPDDVKKVNVNKHRKNETDEQRKERLTKKTKRNWGKVMGKNILTKADLDQRKAKAKAKGKK